jgi:hypothetical protein
MVAVVPIRMAVVPAMTVEAQAIAITVWSVEARPMVGAVPMTIPPDVEMPAINVNGEMPPIVHLGRRRSICGIEVEGLM